MVRSHIRCAAIVLRCASSALHYRYTIASAAQRSDNYLDYPSRHFHPVSSQPSQMARQWCKNIGRKFNPMSRNRLSTSRTNDRRNCDAERKAWREQRTPFLRDPTPIT